jgi:hypothetical protein
MIIDILIQFVALIIYFFFGWLPTVDVMPEWYTQVQDNLGVLSALNAIPLFGTMFTIGMLVILILSAWQGVVFTNWIYNKIRGSG